VSQNRNIDRRRFLKGAAGLAAGTIAFPYIVSYSALGKDGAVAASNRIVMGAIGVGSQGTGDLRGFLGKQEVQMVAVCDVDKAHLDGARKLVDDKYGNSDCKTYADFRALIGRGDLDAVQIAVPDQWHSIPAIAAARAGLDIHAANGQPAAVNREFPSCLRAGSQRADREDRKSRSWAADRQGPGPGKAVASSRYPRLEYVAWPGAVEAVL